MTSVPVAVFVAATIVVSGVFAAVAYSTRVILAIFTVLTLTGDMAALALHFDAAGDANWTFAIAAPSDLQRLAAVTGFWYDWSEERQQFDHPPMLAAIRHGSLVRLLVGGEISSGRLNELVRESSGEFVASYALPARVRFRCFQYDATTDRFALDWGFALLLVPAGAAALTTATMFMAGARARSRQLATR